MKKIISLIILSMPAGATTIYFSDPFPGSSCSNSSCDVIGSPAKFDIKGVQLTLTGGLLAVDIFTNFKNGSLSPYSENGVTFNVGDLFFTVDGIPVYGVPLANHRGSPNLPPNGGPMLLAGRLYSIGVNGLLTAEQVLDDPPLIYRNSTPVWMNNLSVDYTGASSPLSVQPGTDTTVHVSMEFSEVPENLMNALTGVDGVGGILFSSATCGNDVITGSASVPEPLSLLTIGGGLVFLGVLRKKIG